MLDAMPLVTAGLAAPAPCLGSNDRYRGPGPCGLPSALELITNSRSLVLGPNPSPWLMLGKLGHGRGHVSGPAEQFGLGPENLALLAPSLPQNKPDEVLRQMVWPDFCAGKSGQVGAAEGLRPWQGRPLGRGQSAVSLPRIPQSASEIQAGEEARFEGHHSQAGHLRPEMPREGWWLRDPGRGGS